MAKVLGEVSVSEMRSLEGIRKANNDLTMEIGVLEVRKAHLLKQIENLGLRYESTLQGLAQRLEIPEDALWEIDTEGKVILRD